MNKAEEFSKNYCKYHVRQSIITSIKGTQTFTEEYNGCIYSGQCCKQLLKQ